MGDCVDKRAGLSALFTTPRIRYRRERGRYEPARMSLGDLGDLPVPPDLLHDERGHWPWQKPGAPWGQIVSWRGKDSAGGISGNGGGGS